MIRRVLRKTSTGHIQADYGKGESGGRLEIAVTVEEASLVTSEVVDILRKEPLHAPVLDIDFPAALIPSTTPGKFHLYLDTVMSWERYSKLLDALAEAGIIEPGYAQASQAQGCTTVRLPWVEKSKPVSAVGSSDPF